MDKSLRLLNSLLAIVALAIAWPAHAKPTPPPIDKLAAYPKMSSFTLSPDGKHLPRSRAAEKTASSSCGRPTRSTSRRR
jgi:hypothetical protein